MARLARFYEFGGFRLDPDERALYRGNEPVALTPKATETLLALVANAGRVVEKSDLMEAVWRGTFVEESNLSLQIFHLRRALGQQPDGRPYIQTVPRRGFRFLAEVTQPRQPEETTVSILPDLPQARRESAPQYASRYVTWTAVLTVLTLTVAIAWWIRAAAPSVNPGSRVMLAVLPFDHIAADSRNDYLSTGLTEELINRLARLDPDRLGIIGRTSAILYKRSGKDVGQIGKELGVEYVLEGTVRELTGRLRIDVRLIDVPRQSTRWATSVDGDLAEFSDVQTRLAQAVDERIATSLGTSRKASYSHKRRVDPRALSAYQMGRHSFNRLTEAALQNAIDRFNEAVAVQPDYAPGYVGLADAYLMKGFGSASGFEAWSTAKAYAVKAVQLDDSLDRAHAVLAVTKMHSDWDWQGAEREFQRALKINPSSASAHDGYARLLMITGRTEEGIAEQTRAVEADPLAHLFVCNLGFFHYQARQYDRAIGQSRRSLEAFPACPFDHLWAADAYLQKGLASEGIDELKRAVDLHAPGVNALARAYPSRATLDLAYAYAKHGAPQAAIRTLTQLMRTESVDPYLAAPVAVALGDYSEALRLLEEAYERRSFYIPWLAVEPKFDPIRDQPRFAKLVEQLGLKVTRIRG